MDSNFLAENLELKVKEKPKSKIYSSNFLGQFMKNTLINHESTEVDIKSKLNKVLIKIN